MKTKLSPVASALRYHLKLVSSNGKTGPIPVSTSSKATCPDCPFKANGCYAGSGPLNLHWNAVTDGTRGDDWSSFVARIAALSAGQLWRHNQAGDLPGMGDDIDAGMLRDLTRANKGRRGFTYTHKPMTPANLRAVRAAVKAGFTINLSGNDMSHADQLAKTGLPVVCIVPSDTLTNQTTPDGRKVIICPAETPIGERKGVQCATCGICARADRSIIIGFPAHGTQKKRVDIMLKQVA